MVIVLLQLAIIFPPLSLSFTSVYVAFSFLLIGLIWFSVFTNVFTTYLISLKYDTLQNVVDEDTKEIVFSIGTAKAYSKDCIQNINSKERVICAAVINDYSLIYAAYETFDHDFLVSIVSDCYSKTKNYRKGYLTNKGNFKLNKKLK